MGTDGTVLDVGTAGVSDHFEALDACHQNTLVALDQLGALMTQVMATRDIDDDARRLAREVVEHFTTTSRQHHLDEEVHIFPALLATGDAETIQAVQRLQQDHAWLEVDWTALSPCLDAIACGQGCPDPDALQEGVDIFIALSQDHIALEESLIYPQARVYFGLEARGAMARDILARRRAEAA